MARPRIFLSSTCYDLNDSRAALTSFLEGYGFEVLNSQLPSFGVRPKVHSHQACLDEVQKADYVVLIIGGRRGGTFIGSERSITNEEIRTALKLSIPVIAFVDQNVYQQQRTYKKNPKADFSHVVDDVRVFDFIDSISSGHEDNWLRQFGSVNDIIDALRYQFAHYLHLYAQSFRPGQKTEDSPHLVPVPFPSNLDRIGDMIDDPDDAVETRRGLRTVYDAVLSLLSADTKDSTKLEQLKTVWVIGRHGRPDDRTVTLNEDRFKASAWSSSKGQRVFNQMAGTKITGGYEVEEDSNGKAYGVVYVQFNTRNSDTYPGYALKHWIKGLIKHYGEDEGYEVFKRADMRLFMRQERVNGNNSRKLTRPLSMRKPSGKKPTARSTPNR